MTTKEMLAEVLRRAVLKPREKEDLVDLWDRIHRYGNASERQKAWVEKVYFEKKLDRTEVPATVRRRVVIPTWQKERRARHVEKTGVANAGPRDPAIPTVRLVPDAESTVEQPRRIVTVKSTDIQARLRAKAEGSVPSRLSSKTGTFMAVAPQKAFRIGWINYEGAPRELLITNMEGLHDHCPRIRPGTQQYQKIQKFFREGGQVLKIKPSSSTASKVA